MVDSQHGQRRLARVSRSPRSSVVERSAVNRLAVGSSPTAGASFAPAQPLFLVYKWLVHHRWKAVKGFAPRVPPPHGPERHNSRGLVLRGLPEEE